MYLRIVSTTLSPEDITTRLGTQPDEAYAMGSRRRPELPERGHTSWMRRATVPEPGARPEDLEPVVLSWGRAFADAVGALADSGDADVSLVLVQSIRDLGSPAEKGIPLGAELIAWLGAARAGLDIDQYVFHDCEPESDGPV